MVQRSEGVEERPPVGLAALPQVVLPDLYGQVQRTVTSSKPTLDVISWKARRRDIPRILATLLSPLWHGVIGVAAPPMDSGFCSPASD